VARIIKEAKAKEVEMYKGKTVEYWYGNCMAWRKIATDRAAEIKKLKASILALNKKVDSLTKTVSSQAEKLNTQANLLQAADETRASLHAEVAELNGKVKKLEQSLSQGLTEGKLSFWDYIKMAFDTLSKRG